MYLKISNILSADIYLIAKAIYNRDVVWLGHVGVGQQDVVGHQLR